MSHNSYLRKLLSCDEDTTIVEVVGKMRCLLNFLESNKKYKNLVPFLQLYLRVTESVLSEYWKNENIYKDFEHTDLFDVKFAQLYFKPIKDYLLNGKKNTPWQTYFDYCEREDGIPFVQILLGINAHINSDLVTTLINHPYKYKEDYLTVNEILKKNIFQMLIDLIRDHKDLFGLGCLLLQPLTKYEFNEIVVRWRNEAWSNSLLIKTSKYPNSTFMYFQQTEKIGEKIIKIFDKLGKLDDLIFDIEQLNSLKVELHYVSLKDFR